MLLHMVVVTKVPVLKFITTNNTVLIKDIGLDLHLSHICPSMVLHPHMAQKMLLRVDILDRGLGILEVTIRGETMVGSL